MLQSFFLSSSRQPHYFAYTVPAQATSHTCDTMSDESREVNRSNIPPVAASSGPDALAGIFAAAQNFTIANSQFFDVHRNYVLVCDCCIGMKISIIMIILSKSTILQFLLK